jgi:hypothetical protein
VAGKKRLNICGVVLQTVETQGDHAEETGKIGRSGKDGEEGALRGKEIDRKRAMNRIWFGMGIWG